MKNLILPFFWLALAFCVVIFSLKVYAEITKPDIVYDKDVNIIDEILPPETVKEKVVAEVKHEELKWPKYTIRVGLGGARKPIPKITGETVDERARQWLQSQGSTNVKDSLHIWKKFWEEYKMDYTLPLCISWADSSLGKALKSTNNVGNVSNNDRWDVKHYDTLEAWIEAIFWHLAHWKYMSWHEIIGTLSGEWRKRLWLPWCNEEKDYRKKCYATSLVVHSTNTTNCMSVIHNKVIDENYEFRHILAP